MYTRECISGTKKEWIFVYYVYFWKIKSNLNICKKI